MTASEIQADIHSQMAQRHPDLPTDYWTNLGPEAVPVLEHMFETSTSPYEQSWLIAGLAHFTDPSIGILLKSKINSTDNEVTKTQMLGALIQSQGEGAYDFVEPYLKDKNPHIRLIIAKNLRTYASSGRVNSRLSEYQDEESEEWVKKDFSTAPASPVNMKRAGNIFQEKAKELPTKPLSEKEWAGEWKGVYISQAKSSAANATLTLRDKIWSVVIKLPKQTKYELKPGTFEVIYYPSAHAHWIEVRNSKEDSVFIAKRKAKAIP